MDAGAGETSGPFDGPVSAHERAHLIDEMRRRDRAARALGIYFAALMGGLFAYFAYLFSEFGVWWAIGFGALALLIPAWTLWPVSGPDPATRRYRVSTLSGAHGWRIVGAGKAKQRKELIGGAFVEIPPHWLRTVKHWGPMQARVALPEDLPGPSQHLGYDVLAIAGGPSIERERAAGLGERPGFSAWLAMGLVGAALGTIVPIAAFVSAASEGQITLGAAVSALEQSLTAPKSYPTAAALRAAPPAEGARVAVDAAYLLRADLVGGAGGGGDYVLLTKAARDRILAGRDDAAAEHRAAYQAYEAALEEHRLEAGPMFELDAYGRPRLRRGPPAPRAPKVPPVALNPGEAVAYLENPPSLALPETPRGEDPVGALLSSPTSVTGVTAPISAQLAPLRLLPTYAFEEAWSYGVALLVGAFGLAMLLVLGGRGWAIYQRQRAYARRAAEIHAAAGARFML